MRKPGTYGMAQQAQDCEYSQKQTTDEDCRTMSAGDRFQRTFPVLPAFYMLQQRFFVWISFNEKIGAANRAAVRSSGLTAKYVVSTVLSDMFYFENFIGSGREMRHPVI